MGECKVQNSDGVGLPILPLDDPEVMESDLDEWTDEAAFRTLSQPALLTAFATLSVRKHKVVPTTDCVRHTPNATRLDVPSSFVSIINPEFTPQKQWFIKETASVSSKGMGKASKVKQEASKGKENLKTKGNLKAASEGHKEAPQGLTPGKYFYTLAPSGHALDLVTENAEGWWDYIWWVLASGWIVVI